MDKYLMDLKVSIMATIKALKLTLLFHAPEGRAIHHAAVQLIKGYEGVVYATDIGLAGGGLEELITSFDQVVRALDGIQPFLPPKSLELLWPERASILHFKEQFVQARQIELEHEDLLRGIDVRNPSQPDLN